MMEICVHCDENVLVPYYAQEATGDTGPFCCQGCLTVYQTLHEKGLGEYYQVKHDVAFFRRRSPVDIKRESFAYLDGEDFLKEFSYSLASGQRSMEFYLEGIHCLACLWLIEKLPDIVDGVISSKLNLDKSVVVVTINDRGQFSKAASELNHLGYRPHALSRNTEAELLHKTQERKTLIRIGVAGAAAGNIMIYAVSLYGGANAKMGEIFNLFTVVLSFPVLTYCAWPFYQSAWNAIRNRTLSIDVPISLSLILGAVMGVANVFMGIPENYLDSLSTLVFLLLLSRYFLKSIQERGLSTTDLNYFYQSEAVLRQDKEDQNKFEEIHSRYIQTGDVLKIKAEDFFPADGLILSGSTRVNNSLLTGESDPVKVSIGDKVFSGTQNLGQDVLMRVDAANIDSRLGKILRNVENGWANTSRTVDITTQVSKYFTAVTILLSVILFAVQFSQHGFEHALIRAVTLLIVTCPCALALAIPLTFNRALSMAGKNGVIIKSDEVLEKLSTIKRVFLDKTGTVTEGRPSIHDFNILEPVQERIEDVIFTLEEHSRHPVARALINYVLPQRPKRLELSEKLETPGRGVMAKISGHLYEIDRRGILEDGKLVATFKVNDMLRKDSKAIVSRLQSKGISVSMLSGDRPEVVRELGREAGIAEDQLFSEVSPEDKLAMIKRYPDTVMVGDGANDAPALQAAAVGVAVSGAMDISLRASDIFLTTPGLLGVEKIMTLAEETMKVVRRNLILSILYNIVSVIFVFNGVISPLTAAIIMPVSSLTVLLSSLFGTKKLRSLWK